MRERGERESGIERERGGSNQDLGYCEVEQALRDRPRARAQYARMHKRCSRHKCGIYIMMECIIHKSPPQSRLGRRPPRLAGKTPGQ